MGSKTTEEVGLIQAKRLSKNVDELGDRQEKKRKSKKVNTKNHKEKILQS